MKVAVVMNAAAGSIGAAHARARGDAILTALTAAGIDGELHACAGARLTATARALATGGFDAVVAAGAIARIDAGQVNGHVFVNNSSIGLYPLVVRAREAEQRKTGHGKWRAMASAIWRVLRRFPLVTVRVKSDAGAVLTRTPFVFVGNNVYQVSPLALGRRTRLDEGRLCLYTMRCQKRLHMLWLALRAIF